MDHFLKSVLFFWYQKKFLDFVQSLLGLQLEFSQTPKISSWSFSVLQQIPEHTVTGNLGCSYTSQVNISAKEQGDNPVGQGEGAVHGFTAVTRSVQPCDGVWSHLWPPIPQPLGGVLNA